MPQVLMIVESPVKAKKIRGYFPDFDVIATVGHFKDLPPKEFGVSPPHHKPEYIIAEGKQQLVARMIAAAKKADVIYVATDLDREGEAIAGHVVNTLGNAHNAKVSRITYDELSKAAIQKAIAAKRSVDWPLVRAQEARRVLDRYVGYTVSPALAKKFQKAGFAERLSAGRVQSVAVRLIVEREQEIHAFTPVTHYGIKARLIKAGVEFDVVWKPNKPAGEFITDIREAQLVKGRTNTLTLIELNQTPRKVSPPKPLITSSYVRLMGAALKLTTKKAMDAAQTLFEHGLITYHRTDSPTMSEEFMVTVRDFAVRHKLPIPNASMQAKASANAQAGHECLRVTDINLLNARAAGIDEPLLQAVYQLVWMVTLESQLLAGEDLLKTATFINQAQDVFVCKTKSKKFLGWRQAAVLFAQGASNQDATAALDGENNDEASLASLPDVQLKESLTPLAVDLITKHTEPPSAYTEKTLVEKMDKLGIGRPSTYAQVIERIIYMDYVTRDAKTIRLDPTPIGTAIVLSMNNHFSFMEYAYTAQMEEAFDLIAQRKAEYLPVVHEAWLALTEEMKKFEAGQLPEAIDAMIKSITTADAESVSAPRTNTSKKYGAAAGKASAKKVSPLKKSTSTTTASATTKPATKASPSEKCPTCHKGTLEIKKLKSGKNIGKPFLGCNNFPTCNFFQWMQ